MIPKGWEQTNQARIAPVYCLEGVSNEEDVTGRAWLTLWVEKMQFRVQGDQGSYGLWDTVLEPQMSAEGPP